MRPPPKTCAEAADRLRTKASRAIWNHEYERMMGQADVLEVFGDTPCPKRLLEEWDFSL